LRKLARFLSFSLKLTGCNQLGKKKQTAHKKGSVSKQVAFPLRHTYTAIDIDDFAGNKGSLVRDKKQDCPGHIGWLTLAGQWRVIHRILAHLGR